ncbi:MAG: hypothetical protein LUD50_01315, partial [Clostridia bacterium]|nr:hypothetical protein [Clostridia bacterium]
IIYVQRGNFNTNLLFFVQIPQNCPECKQNANILHPHRTMAAGGLSGPSDESGTLFRAASEPSDESGTLFRAASEPSAESGIRCWAASEPSAESGTLSGPLQGVEAALISQRGAGTGP